jgi:hypothetical protein
MGAAAFACYKVLMLIVKSNLISCAFAIIFAVIVYAIMVLVTGTLKIEEIRRLPKGDKLVSILNRVLKK